MIKITVEINGRPVSSASFKDAFEAAAIEGIRQKMQDSLERGLTHDELSKLTVKLVGTSLSSLSLNLSGPDEILKKAKTAVGSK